MASNAIYENLKSSSKKVASKIGKLTVERKELEEELNSYENSLTKLEAMIEVHRENRDKYHGELRDMKVEKNEIYRKRDELIEKKRGVQRNKYEVDDQTAAHYDKKLNNLSDKIGAIIEKSKEHSAKMQELYEKGQEEHEFMIKATKEFKQEKYESNNKILVYKTKIAEIDNQLNSLRRKMNTINEKLSEFKK